MVLEDGRQDNTYEDAKLHRKMESNALHVYSKWSYFASGITEAGAFLINIQIRIVLFY